MAAGRPRNKAKAEENLRAVLGADVTERTIDAARRVVAERDKLRIELADVGKGLAAAWERIAATEGHDATN
jgi:hypothetical protein